MRLGESFLFFGLDLVADVLIDFLSDDWFHDGFIDVSGSESSEGVWSILDADESVDSETKFLHDFAYFAIFAGGECEFEPGVPGLAVFEGALEGAVLLSGDGHAGSNFGEFGLVDCAVDADSVGLMG